ncbi:MAG: M23 family metallopeptidase [Bacteroidota bacterium]
MKLKIHTFLFAFIHLVCFGQNNYQSPLDIPLELAANFGELRPHHFHMGLDFKTKGKEGFNIRSIQKGYVSRVKISRSGYGKMIQIAHPNGQSSVYAHCQSFKGKIDSLVKEIQRREQNEEIEIYFSENEIVVERGQIIAISGNTGGSTAPHLHFELRETATDDALNPLLHGFFIPDHKAPTVKSLKIYALTKEGFTIPGKTLLIPLTPAKNGVTTVAEQIVLPADFCRQNGQIGFAIDAFDQFDNSANKCGIFSTELFVNSELQFHSKLAQIGFDATRDINCHMDHGEFLKGNDFHKLYQTEENELDITSISKGIIALHPGENLVLKIVVGDAKKNSSTIHFKLQVPSILLSEKSIFNEEDYYFPGQAITLSTEAIHFSAKAHTLYEPIRKNDFQAEKLIFGSSSIPLQQSYDLLFKKAQSNKSYLQVRSEKNGRKVESLYPLAQMSLAQPTNLGPMLILQDLTPPTIKPIVLSGPMLKWTAFDSETSLADYDLYVDGEWQLLEYESKLDLLFYKKSNLKMSAHSIKIVLVDALGNTTNWEQILSY